MDTHQSARARDLGILIGSGTPGPNNAITDVPGVRVGHVTLVEGSGPLVIGKGPVRTGVTAILPPGENWHDDPVEAGCFVFNGAGTVAGLSCIEEFGRIETPVMLTNTLSVGTVYEGVVRYMVEHIFREKGRVPWFNPVVGETSDAGMSDIGGLHVRPEHAVEAIEIASGGPVEEGCVGGGTGMKALGYKAGIGTASRIIQMGGEAHTIGVLVQSNFGGKLTVKGVQITDQPTPTHPPDSEGASIMIIVATDLPLPNRLLNRLAKRAVLGMARAGSTGGHGSGDYVISFSTTCRHPDAATAARVALAENETLIDAPFQAVADATEEAILNSLFQAETVEGIDGQIWEAVSIDDVLRLLQARGVID
jgi:D-aminopeptidase